MRVATLDHQELDRPQGGETPGLHPVTEALLTIVDDDPLPAGHTSSHWQQYGQATVVARQGTDVQLRASGFEPVQHLPRHARFLSAVERFSYRAAIAQLRSYRSIWALAHDLAEDLAASASFNVFKSVCVLATLADHWAAHRLSPTRFALIGDGYGFLGALIRRLRPDARLYCIDLPKILVFQAHIHARADRRVRMTLLSRRAVLDDGADVTLVPPQHMEDVPGPIDCAITVDSMQEMSPWSISGYFAFLRRRSTSSSRFYCLNRLHKELPGGEIADFHAYPWREADEIFLDGVCPFHTHFLAPYTLPIGPRVWQVRVPFVNQFDGTHMHRLVRLAPP